MGEITDTHAAVSPFLDDIRQREAAARVEGFRAGAEAALARIVAHRDGFLSIEEAALLNVLEAEIRRAIPEEQNNG